MTVAEVDAYFAAAPQPQRSALEATRALILQMYPEAEQVISYALPAFKVDGIIVAGLGATKNGLSFYPHSGQVLSAAGELVAAYSQTKGALHVPAGQTLSRELLAVLIELKLAQARR